MSSYFSSFLNLPHVRSFARYMLVCPNPPLAPLFTELPPDPAPRFGFVPSMPKEMLHLQPLWEAFYACLCCCLTVLVLTYVVDLCLQLLYGPISSDFPPSSSSSSSFRSTLSSTTSIVPEGDFSRRTKMNEPKILPVTREPAGTDGLRFTPASSSLMNEQEEPLVIFGGPMDGLTGTLDLNYSQKVEFTYMNDEACEVGLLFNDLNFIVPLEPDRGFFSLCLSLPAGRHSYRFVVGQEE